MCEPKKYKGDDRFNSWEEFRKVDVWNSAPYKFQRRWSKMKTKTDKFELYSKTLNKALSEHTEHKNTDIRFHMVSYLNRYW